MKILYVSQFFYPGSTAAAFRAYDHARIWQAAGDSVTVFTSYPHSPSKKTVSGYKRKLCKEEFIANVKVVRSYGNACSSNSFFLRIFNMSSFLFFGIINMMFNGKKIGKNFDIVLGTSGPVFAALLAWLYAAFHRLPFVFELRDITYRQLIATGKKRSSLSVKMMKKLELFLCRRACHILVVTNGFKDILVSDGIDKNKISVITNGFEVLPLDERQVVDSGIHLGYFGTVGISQRIEETFVYAAEIANIQDNFTYQIIGEGAQRDAIEKLLQEGKYPYIQLLHGMMPKDLESYYLQTNLSVVKLVASDDFKYTLPSKLFQIMGRGIAILFIGPDGEAAEIVRKYKAGIVLCGNVQENIQVLRDFFGQPDYQKQLNKMGKNGYEAVCRYYNRKVLATDCLNVLRNCLRLQTKTRKENN